MARVENSLRRALDIIVAVLGLIFLSPLALVLALLIKLTSPGPVFYRARRVGKGGCQFALLKFRTMVQDADRQGPPLTLADDTRVTTIGRWLRGHRLDELPQLWNVLKGDMSLVGPRPEDPYYVSFYSPDQRQVLSVRPGVTGLAQIGFRNEGDRLRSAVDPEKTYTREILPAKLAVDLAYLESRTLLTDVLVLLRTLRIYLGNRTLLLFDLVSLGLAFVLAFVIRFDASSYSATGQLALYWPVFLPIATIKLIVFERMGLYRRAWRFASVKDMLAIVLAVAMGSTLSGALILILWAWPWSSTFVHGFPRSVIVIDAMLTLFLIGGQRFFTRWRREMALEGGRNGHRGDQLARSVLLIGAGEAGAVAVREMQRNPQLGYRPAGFLDDDPDTRGQSIYGVPVVGPISQLPQAASSLAVSEVLIAVPAAPGELVRRVFQLAREAGLAVRTLPTYDEVLSSHVSVRRAREVRLEDLLRRPPTPMEMSGIAAYLTDQTVLVTGAGGSIGSELCRQVCRFMPAHLLLFDHSENNLYQIDAEMNLNFPDVDCRPILGTVRDQAKLAHLLVDHKPSVIFHAAAYKHVPLSESNEDEEILNNVIGTHNLVSAAVSCGVPRFVFISTDKAVAPINVMGKTKQVGEWIVQDAAQRSGLPYVAVRFGNVLGSHGSVVPLFQSQIAHGGPVTVTHAQVTRYFMTIPEAARLVLQAAILGRGGEVFVLDMGEPVRIYDLACDLIRLNGLEPERDISIVFTGLRPGEKLTETLYNAGEQVSSTGHPGIHLANTRSPLTAGQLSQLLAALQAAAQAHNLGQIRQLLDGAAGPLQP